MDWLDALRGLAVLGMLHTHVTNTLLDPMWHAGRGFDGLRYLHGLVAPSFLWIAGYAHGIGLWRRLAGDMPGFPWRTVRRLVVVGMIGYALHFPWGGSAAAWAAFRATDVLQCLAASLLVLVALERVAWRFCPGAWRMTCVLSLVILAGLASVLPVPHGEVFQVGPAAVRAYFDTSGTSLFPLLPWFGFVAAGALAAAVPAAWRRLMVPVAVLACLCPQPAVFSALAPGFFLQRLGWVALAAQAADWFGRQRAYPSWLLLAGRESLVVYVGHLILLHWLPWAPAIGRTLTPARVSLVFLLLAGLSLLLAFASDKWKIRRR
jgi:uncharacterized membrane protein